MGRALPHLRKKRCAYIQKINTTVSTDGYIDFVLKLFFKVALENSETEQPASFAQAEATEDNDVVNSKDAEVPNFQLTNEENNAVANEGPTPAPSPVPTPRSGQNGNLIKGTPDLTSTGGNAVSPYINGGIINKRYSYTESLDMSIPKENTSISARVSQLKTRVPAHACSMNIISPSRG